MSKYYLVGYTPPADVTGPEKVKEYQKQLGVTIDGIWGPKTQAAYDSRNKNSSTLDKNSSTFMNYYNSLLSGMTVPQVSAETPSKAELAADISEFLRPSYDTAISNRKKAGYSNMAEIDADAASRGMGSSTFVTSMKAREQDDVYNDISELETGYASTLAKSVYDAMSSYRDLALEAEKFNAQAQLDANNAALSAAKTIYSAFLEQLSAELAASSASSSSGSSSSSASSSSSSGKSSSSSNKSENKETSTTETSRTLTYNECILYLSSLSNSQLRLLMTSTNDIWVQRRDMLMDSLGEDQFYRLVGKNGEFYYAR
ncbi:MAG: hypothetical protein IJO48_06225 [Clostridia bacterium]|nr:hypothetical protein [Clostridia bacterium]